MPGSHVGFTHKLGNPLPQILDPPLLKSWEGPGNEAIHALTLNQSTCFVSKHECTRMVTVSKNNDLQYFRESPCNT